MSTKTIIIGVVLFSLVFIGGAYVLLAGSNKPSASLASYTSQDKNKPIVEVKRTSADLGKIKVSEEKSADFTIKNIGTKPLQLYNMSSSCNCTTGELIYEGKTSMEYGMHNVSDTLPEIAPNTEAKIRVIYRPFVMPVYGPIEREVFMSTNDPQNPKLLFQIKTIVN